jgi:flavin-dependent dehydrogenase
VIAPNQALFSPLFLNLLLCCPRVLHNTGAKVKGRVLVCADGATSQLATKLGYCTEAPRGVCSRAFVSGGTHNAKFDGVCFYPKWSLPGYAALFRWA